MISKFLKAGLAWAILSASCFVSVANAGVITIAPNVPLVAESGPFGFGGRGVVFRAEEDFTMSSFGMQLSFLGNLDFSVDVYNVVGNARSSLLSQSNYSNLADDGSQFFTLSHTQSFTAGNIYEVIMRFEDPGVVFEHYDFNNPSLNIASGFSAGNELLVLDGSDFDNGLYNNTWLASFQITTEQTSSNDVPEPSTLAIFALGIAGLVTRRLNK